MREHLLYIRVVGLQLQCFVHALQTCVGIEQVFKDDLAFADEQGRLTLAIRVLKLQVKELHRRVGCALATQLLPRLIEGERSFGGSQDLWPQFLQLRKRL